MNAAATALAHLEGVRRTGPSHGTAPGGGMKALTQRINSPPKQDAANLTGAHDETPEHRNERRRFLIFALMAGLVPPERVTERIVSEIEQQQQDSSERSDEVEAEPKL